MIVTINANSSNIPIGMNTPNIMSTVGPKTNMYATAITVTEIQQPKAIRFFDSISCTEIESESFDI
jgi:hypothetical protein